jgi:hypothetical protein
MTSLEKLPQIAFRLSGMDITLKRCAGGDECTNECPKEPNECPKERRRRS